MFNRYTYIKLILLALLILCLFSTVTNGQNLSETEEMRSDGKGITFKEDLSFLQSKLGLNEYGNYFMTTELWEGARWKINTYYGYWFPTVDSVANFAIDNTSWGQVRTKNYLNVDDTLVFDATFYLNSGGNPDGAYFGFGDSWVGYEGKFIGIQFKEGNITFSERMSGQFPVTLNIIGSYSAGERIIIKICYKSNGQLWASVKGFDGSFTPSESITFIRGLVTIQDATVGQGFYIRSINRGNIGSLNLGLTTHYPLDGTPDDIGLNNYDGSFYGTTNATIDRNNFSNSAMNFNGSNGYMQADYNVIPASGNFTVSVWAKTNTLQSGYREIISQNADEANPPYNFYIGKNPENKIRVGDDWGDFYPTGVDFPMDNNWHLYTVVKTELNTFLYLDGTLVATREGGIRNPDGTEFRIARQYGPLAEFFDGVVDDIRIYDRALSAVEVFELFNENGGGTEYILRQHITNVPFELNLDTWKFGNYAGNLWPNSSERFLSWELFVLAFGENQCYWHIGNLKIPKQSAFAYWLLLGNVFKDWKGSCGGFAISTFLAFDRKNDFINKFPELPSFTYLNELPSAEENEYIRDLINQLFVYQFGQDELNYYLQNLPSIQPNNCISDIKNMFQATDGDNRYLMLWDIPNLKIHAVNPYKIVQDPNDQNIKYIHIYDNATTDDTYGTTPDNKIKINTQTNTWSYIESSFQENNYGLFLSRPVSTFLDYPRLPLSNNEYFISKEKLNNSNILLFNLNTSNVIIKDSANLEIGYQDTTVIFDLPNSLPIIPITNSKMAPVGYILPKRIYNITYDNFRDTVMMISMIKDSLMMSYLRTNIDPLQQDKFRIKDGVTVLTEDNVTKSFNFQSILMRDTSEQSFGINSLTIALGDSIELLQLQQDKMTIINYGESNNYDLRINFLSSNTNIIFEHFNIILEPSSTHLVNADLSALLQNEIVIYKDIDNNGTIDDSISLINQATDVPQNDINKYVPEFSLAQNYPNPFNPNTTINYSIPNAAKVELIVFNLLGQEIATLVHQEKPAGNYEVNFDASNLPSGVYIYKMKAGEYVQTRKMILLK